VKKFQREEIDVIGDLIQSRAKRVIETSVTCGIFHISHAKDYEQKAETYRQKKLELILH
jgi:hypothetical protein